MGSPYGFSRRLSGICAVLLTSIKHPHETQLSCHLFTFDFFQSNPSTGCFCPLQTEIKRELTAPQSFKRRIPFGCAKFLAMAVSIKHSTNRFEGGINRKQHRPSSPPMIRQKPCKILPGNGIRRMGTNGISLHIRFVYGMV